MDRLADHGRERHAPPDGQLLRYADGRPVTSRRYDHLWTRIGRHLPWVRTQQIINSMKAQIATVQSKVASLKPVTVFDYDSGTAAPFTGPGLAMPNAEITLGGGTNTFASLKQSWTSVSWEQVVKADPQCIIINNYSTPSAAQKEQFLETSPITKNLTAVKNRCFLPLTYDQVTPSPRNGEAIIAIAHWLHPSAFGLPPRRLLNARRSPGDRPEFADRFAFICGIRA
jgi:hypothetical protein